MCCLNLSLFGGTDMTALKAAGLLATTTHAAPAGGPRSPAQQAGAKPPRPLWWANNSHLTAWILPRAGGLSGKLLPCVQPHKQAAAAQPTSQANPMYASCDLNLKLLFPPSAWHALMPSSG